MSACEEQFVRRAQRAPEAGFDMIELHMAHGYLLSSFISPLTNQRSDEYGGSLDNRLRYPFEVFDAVRAAWPQDKPISVRISATDWAEGGLTGEDSVRIAEQFKAHGVDLIDVSTGQTTHLARPVYGRMFQTPFAEAIRNDAHVATMAVGTSPAPTRSTPSSRPAVPTWWPSGDCISATRGSPCRRPLTTGTKPNHGPTSTAPAATRRSAWPNAPTPMPRP
jgi:anthraniloyl-CoA monooxygenase